MRAAVPALLVAAGLDEARGTVDGGRDAAHGAGVEVEQQRGEGGRGRALGRDGGGVGRGIGEAAGGGGGRAVRDPVVHEEGDMWVGEEVGHLLGGGVGGHDDEWGRGVGRGRGREVGVVHEGDGGDVVCAGC